MTRRQWVVATVYVAVMAALGGIAVWPIYVSLPIVGVLFSATVLGGALAIARRRWSWSTPISAAAVAGAWAVPALTVGTPARWASGSPFPGVFVDAGTALVTGWKDLATVPLPVGDYRNLLIPALTVFLLSTFFAVTIATRDDRRAPLAVILAGLMPFFGLVYGRTATSPPLVLGAVYINAPVETAIAAGSVLATVWWLSWRADERRQSALRAAAIATEMHESAAKRGTNLRRAGGALAMSAIAVVIALVAAPAVAGDRPRDVLRSGVELDLALSRAVSPLAEYRENFTDAAFAEPLFTVSSAGALPDRVRLATLTSYDGQTYRVSPSDADPFLRVPSRVDVSGGKEVKAVITIQGLTGIWLPSFGTVESVDFEGAAASSLSDGFYYSSRTQTAVEALGVSKGDTYEMTAVEKSTPELEDAHPSGGRPAVALPQSLLDWVEAQEVSDDGAGLATLIDRLRERGYLSHALSLPDGESAAWMEPLGDYTFQSSAAGHSLARIGTLFEQLNDRQQEVGADGGDALVAAVGDDEQFAVAGALLAQTLGFDSRIVVGVRLAETELPACQDGACREGDMSAWIEVKSGDSWITVDTTPQYDLPVDAETTQLLDPQIPTDVLPDSAEEVQPPDPTRQDANEEEESQTKDALASDVANVLKIVAAVGGGISVLLLPFLIILLIKLLRRRRRRSREASAAIAGGWEEYVDAAVDAGHSPPGVLTRVEVARVYATPAAQQLADGADYAVCAGESVDSDAVDAYWQLVKNERRALGAGRGWWIRLRYALSLRSFTRQLGTSEDASEAKKSRAHGGRARRTTTQTTHG